MTVNVTAVASEFPITPWLPLTSSIVLVASGVIELLAALVTLFRLALRLRIRRLWWEDVWAAVAMVCAIAFAIVILVYFQTRQSCHDVRIFGHTMNYPSRKLRDSGCCLLDRFIPIHEHRVVSLERRISHYHDSRVYNCQVRSNESTLFNSPGHLAYH